MPPMNPPCCQAAKVAPHPPWIATPNQGGNRLGSRALVQIREAGSVVGGFLADRAVAGLTVDPTVVSGVCTYFSSTAMTALLKRLYSSIGGASSRRRDSGAAGLAQAAATIVRKYRCQAHLAHLCLPGLTEQRVVIDYAAFRCRNRYNGATSGLGSLPKCASSTHAPRFIGAPRRAGGCERVPAQHYCEQLAHQIR